MTMNLVKREYSINVKEILLVRLALEIFYPLNISDKASHPHSLPLHQLLSKSFSFSTILLQFIIQTPDGIKVL